MQDPTCRFTRLTHLGLLLPTLALLAACGGGGGGGGDPGDPDTYTVSATAGTGGSIAPASRTVDAGNTTTFTVTPNSGYNIASVIGCNGSLNGSTYTTAAINATCTVTASFAPVTYTVNATAGTGGSIAPASRTVNSGNTTTFTVTPDSGYNIDNVIGCNGSLNGSTYTTAAINATCTVTASFAEIQEPPPDSETGLDSRPSNTSCIAPQRPNVGGSYRLERVFAGLGNLPAPLFMGQPPGDDSRWFVAGRLGQILSFENQPNVSDTTTVLTIPIINPPDEGGLLGFAFAPDFATSGEAYVSYTRNVNAGGVALQSVISRFTSDDNGQTLDPDSEQQILVINHPFSNHNGGGIHFGPDGYLYLGMGDGGSIRDPQDNARNTRNLLGTFIRIDVSGGGTGYTIPSDNPFFGNPLCSNGGSGTDDCPEIFAWGLRNPFRWSFDRDTGDLWAGDVGNLLREEVNVIRLGGDYGWKIREGMICLDPNDNFGILDECDDAGLIDPVVDYQTGVVGRSVIGGYVYRGESLPALRGRYIFGDAYNSSVWMLQENAGGPNTIVDLVPDTGLFIAAFAESLDGDDLFVVNLSSTLHQLVADGSSGNNTIPDQLSDTGCVNPLDPTQVASGLIPYSPGAPFWSDGAAKERWLALPNNASITVGDDDNFVFPAGSVLVKHFRRLNQLIETRLLMRHPDGVWAGYTYRWNEQQTDATRVIGGATLPAGGANWIYPSESQCLQCHTDAASRTLGLEIAQLNNPLTYPQTGRRANQLATLDAIDLLSPPLSGAPDTLPALPDPFGTAPLAERARAYLHSNCAGCHQPGTPLQSTMDLRYDTPLANTNACNAESLTGGSLGIANARLIAPGEASRSLVPQRMNRRDAYAMPPIGSLQVDNAGVSLIGAWINSLASCN